MWAPSLEYTEACQGGSKTYMWAPSLEYTEACQEGSKTYMWAPENIQKLVKGVVKPICGHQA